MRYLLDTDVISQGTKLRPNASVLQWLQKVDRKDLRLSVITIEEVRAGAEAMPMGRKRSAVESWLEDDLLIGFESRILPVSVEVANLCGRIIVRTRRRGREASLGDALIAATAVMHGLALVTLNRKHFEQLGVELVDF